MRVLFWSGTFWPRVGGFETLATELLPALRARGHELSVVTSREAPGRDGPLQLGSILIHRLAFDEDREVPEAHAARVLALRKQVALLKRDVAPELIHLNAGGASDFFH